MRWLSVGFTSKNRASTASHAERLQALDVLAQVPLGGGTVVEEVRSAGASARRVFRAKLPAQTRLAGDIAGQSGAGLRQRSAPRPVEGELDLQKNR